MDATTIRARFAAWCAAERVAGLSLVRVKSLPGGNARSELWFQADASLGRQPAEAQARRFVDAIAERPPRPWWEVRPAPRPDRDRLKQRAQSIVHFARRFVTRYDAITIGPASVHPGWPDEPWATVPVVHHGSPFDVDGPTAAAAIARALKLHDPVLARGVAFVAEPGPPLHGHERGLR